MPATSPKCASVSHDGEAIYGAQVIAAIESAAFVESDLNRLLDIALDLIPKDCLIRKLIGQLRDLRQREPDWYKAFAWLKQNYGYDKFGGGCHMIPNHGLVILALLWSDDSFSKAQTIVNTCGWDTDCNAANVGCIMGIKKGLADSLNLGNLEAHRDWGFAGDYVRAMWLMLQQPVPEDYVIASGQTHSVREFVELAFSHLGMDYRNYLQIDPELLRPSEADLLQGDARRARETMGWTSTISFQELVCEMVESDLRRLSPAPPRQEVASEESRPGRLVVISSRHRADSGPDTLPLANHRTVGFTTGRNRE